MNLGRSQLVTTAPEAPQRAEVGAERGAGTI
jgi:hypothetical protein